MILLPSLFTIQSRGLTTWRKETYENIVGIVCQVQDTGNMCLFAHENYETWIVCGLNGVAALFFLQAKDSRINFFCKSLLSEALGQGSELSSPCSLQQEDIDGPISLT